MNLIVTLFMGWSSMLNGYETCAEAFSFIFSRYTSIEYLNLVMNTSLC